MRTSVEATVRFADVIHAGRLRGASDVHVAPDVPVAVRIDGTLLFSEATFSLDEVRELLNRVLSEASNEVFMRLGDVTTSMELADGSRARVHVLRSAGRPAFAIRLLDREPPSLAVLDLPPVVRSFALRTSGLVIFAGPTGCGKSTTLAAMVAYINETAARRILTIEDPVEYRHRNARSFISQREVGDDAPTLGAALIGALRSDPDVLVVGEARDVASMRPMLTAAETGHLVFATLHTASASETADRIVDVFDSESQAQARVTLAQTLVGIVCQRLVQRTSSGRRAVVEVLVATPAVRSLIRQEKTHMISNAIATGRNHGMITFAQHADELAAGNEISADEARRFAEPAPAAA